MMMSVLVLPLMVLMLPGIVLGPHGAVLVSPVVVWRWSGVVLWTLGIVLEPLGVVLVPHSKCFRGATWSCHGANMGLSWRRLRGWPGVVMVLRPMAGCLGYPRAIWVVMIPLVAVLWSHWDVLELDLICQYIIEVNTTNCDIWINASLPSLVTVVPRSILSYYINIIPAYNNYCITFLPRCKLDIRGMDFHRKYGSPLISTGVCDV